MSDQPTAAQLFAAAVGERVFVFRLTHRLSRAELAAKAGMSADYVYRIEQGWANPRITTMQKLALALGTTVQELLDVDGEELGLAAENTERSCPDPH